MDSTFEESDELDESDYESDDVAKAVSRVRAKKRKAEERKAEEKPKKEPKKARDGDGDGGDGGSGSGDANSGGNTTGIRQTPSGKWYGQVNNQLKKTKSGGPKIEYTPCFATKEEAIEARAVLKARIEAKYETRAVDLASKDPSTQGLDRIPFPSCSKGMTDLPLRQAYWTIGRKTGQLPIRVVRVVKVWNQGCKKCPPNDASVAVGNGIGGKAEFCVPCGGGCIHNRKPGKCMTCQNEHRGGTAHLTIFCNEDCGTRLDTKRQESQGGNGLCTACEDRLFPSRKGSRKRNCTPKSTFVSREQFLAIADEEHFPEIEAEAIGGVVCDGPVGTGQSRRRTDRAATLMDPELKTPFMMLTECDERAHLDGSNCYDRDGVLGKFSGHMSDMGAPAIDPQEADYVEANPLTAEEMNGSVQNAKTRNVARVLNKITNAEAKMMPFRVLSIGVDRYTDSKGQKHKSAFEEYRLSNGEKRIRANEEEWAHRVECFVREKKKLLAMGASGSTMVHIRLFYDGSDAETGLHPSCNDGEDDSD